MSFLQVYIVSNVGSFILGAAAATALLLWRNKSSLPEYKSAACRRVLADFEASKPKDYEKRK